MVVEGTRRPCRLPRAYMSLVRKGKKPSFKIK